MVCLGKRQAGLPDDEGCSCKANSLGAGRGKTKEDIPASALCKADWCFIVVVAAMARFIAVRCSRRPRIDLVGAQLKRLCDLHVLSVGPAVLSRETSLRLIQG